jgi:hypothetical protein
LLKFNAVRFENVRFWKKPSLYASKTLVFEKKPSLYAFKKLNLKLTLPSLAKDLEIDGLNQSSVERPAPKCLSTFNQCTKLPPHWGFKLMSSRSGVRRYN